MLHVINHISYIVYRISYIIYYISYVIYHMSYIIYYILYIKGHQLADSGPGPDSERLLSGSLDIFCGTNINL